MVIYLSLFLFFFYRKNYFLYRFFFFFFIYSYPTIHFSAKDMGSPFCLNIRERCFLFFSLTFRTIHFFQWNLREDNTLLSQHLSDVQILVYLVYQFSIILFSWRRMCDPTLSLNPVKLNTERHSRTSIIIIFYTNLISFSSLITLDHSTFQRRLRASSAGTPVKITRPLFPSVKKQCIIRRVREEAHKRCLRRRKIHMFTTAIYPKRAIKT